MGIEGSQAQARHIGFRLLARAGARLGGWAKAGKIRESLEF